MVLLDSSIVLLNFYVNCSKVLFDFSIIFTYFFHNFIPFFHGLPNFQIILFDFSMIFLKKKSMVLLVFYIILPFHSSSPNVFRRTDQGGIDTPPSPNCHLVHNHEKKLVV